MIIFGQVRGGLVHQGKRYAVTVDQSGAGQFSALGVIRPNRFRAIIRNFGSHAESYSCSTSPKQLRLLFRKKWIQIRSAVRTTTIHSHLRATEGSTAVARRAGI